MSELLDIAAAVGTPFLIFMVLLALACYGFQMLRLFFKF